MVSACPNRAMPARLDVDRAEGAAVGSGVGLRSMRDHGTLGEFSRSVDELATVAQQRTGRLELLSLDEATEAVVIKQALALRLGYKPDAADDLPKPAHDR